jgi:hypothetical protein
LTANFQDLLNRSSKQISNIRNWCFCFRVNVNCSNASIIMHISAMDPLYSIYLSWCLSLMQYCFSSLHHFEKSIKAQYCSSWQTSIKLNIHIWLIAQPKSVLCRNKYIWHIDLYFNGYSISLEGGLVSELRDRLQKREQDSS